MANRKPYRMITCQYCGKDFEARKFIKSGPRKGHSSGFRKTRYCSYTCSNRALAETSIGWIHKKTGYRCFSIKGKMIQEHRVVMEQTLGRELLANETVHHKNGNRLDNRPENLELWSTRHGRGQRVADLPLMPKTPEDFVLGALSFGG